MADQIVKRVTVVVLAFISSTAAAAEPAPAAAPTCRVIDENVRAASGTVQKAYRTQCPGFAPTVTEITYTLPNRPLAQSSRVTAPRPAPPAAR
ncbi:MAG TPA: hypothetical protein VGB70_00630 [Allosphingosinicella sp.]